METGGGNLQARLVGEAECSATQAQMMAGDDSHLFPPSGQGDRASEEKNMDKMLFERDRSTDLYNWKHQTPPYSTDPKGKTELIEGIFLTHNPMWVDIQQLLAVLLTIEERRLVREAALRYAEGRFKDDDNVLIAAEGVVPALKPDWHGNGARTPAHDRALLRYRECIVEGLRRGVPKQQSVQKVYAVMQGPNETPSAYLE
ncbi:hypothetical protein JRQ81_002962 [Phrynocephalus forsythii]|uniref:Core shell protein Gag P30 domain-containing protein n=1 Tax=Phrynocephalus forsythii TaxID=171643 RepID=A0A9Q1AWZ9_9SAUR|nr:hypothetical protein JRQ81_002962 [Phrynocephalus forsythii]